MTSAHGTAWVTAGKEQRSRGLRSKLSLGATKSGQEPECERSAGYILKECELKTSHVIKQSHGYSQFATAREKISRRQFRRIITTLCQRWHIPEYADYLTERYWPAFSRLDEAGQSAFWDVLGAREVDMPPRIAIFV